ncbi:hypothetical protein SAMN06296020_104193 [Anoxynatronum buryatiense]|uniref:Uncharacterized protein n=1 Tax=Anoxynatronum buryatiense TaxID=489973 RepID=A0AA45WV87_9CLOT|nr:hypothetical protein SAMN06296020_104193 [Anoxynatronum buryatiense]
MTEAFYCIKKHDIMLSNIQDRAFRQLAQRFGMGNGAD